MSQYIHGQTLIQYLEEWAPKKLAFEGDRIGCQIGTLNKPVKKVMVTLDVFESVVDEAIEKDIDLIITHHAVIYKPLKTVRNDVGQGKIVTKCIKHDIAVYTMHTNFDIAAGGMNDLLAEKVGLKNVEILQPTYAEPLYKLIVYVPTDHAEELRRVLGDAGAGHIGGYSHCSFSTPGEGRFLPGKGTDPHIGSQGKLEKVVEEKIETIVTKAAVNKVIAKMLKAHPYEEVAYDLFLLENQGEQYGLGRIGNVPEKKTLRELAELATSHLQLNGVRYTGDPDKIIKKAAVLGGDGTSLIPYARYQGADVLLTGDIDHHTAQEAILHDLCLIDIGHHAEKVMIPAVTDYIAKKLSIDQSSTEVVASETDTNPFRFL